MRESERRRRLPGDVGVCEEMEVLERWEATDWRRWGEGAGEMEMESAEGRRECVGVWGVDGMVRASVYAVPRRHGEGGTTQRFVVITRRRGVHMRYMRVRLLTGLSVAVVDAKEKAFRARSVRCSRKGELEAAMSFP